MLLQDLADRLDLVPMGFDTLQRRQAEEFVEPLEQAEADEFPTKAERDGIGICTGIDFDGVRVSHLE
jgi:hypothetical protein